MTPSTVFLGVLHGNILALDKPRPGRLMKLHFMPLRLMPWPSIEQASAIIVITRYAHTFINIFGRLVIAGMCKIDVASIFTARVFTRIIRELHFLHSHIPCGKNQLGAKSGVSQKSSKSIQQPKTISLLTFCWWCVPSRWGLVKASSEQSPSLLAHQKSKASSRGEKRVETIADEEEEMVPNATTQRKRENPHEIICTVALVDHRHPELLSYGRMIVPCCFWTVYCFPVFFCCSSRYSSSEASRMSYSSSVKKPSSDSSAHSSSTPQSSKSSDSFSTSSTGSDFTSS